MEEGLVPFAKEEIEAQEARKCVHGFPAGKWQEQDLNLVGLTLKSVLLTIRLQKTPKYGKHKHVWLNGVSEDLFILARARKSHGLYAMPTEYGTECILILTLPK